MTRFWNNLLQVCLMSKDCKPVFGARNQSDLNRITKISYGHLSIMNISNKPTPKLVFVASALSTQH